jgi:hypothetical protein
MIFAHTWQQVLDGTKTQTRRTVKDGDATGLKWLRERCGLGLMVVRAGRVLWRESATYAVQQGRGKHAVGRLIVTEIRYCARAGDISEADAIAEGFASAEGFRAMYARINGAAALEKPCWCLTFERNEGAKDGGEAIL